LFYHMSNVIFNFRIGGQSVLHASMIKVHLWWNGKI